MSRDTVVMFPILISVVCAKLVNCNFLEAEANYQKPKLERNNILNKGIWVRNKIGENLFEKRSLGNVVFRSSMDAERLESAFDNIRDDGMEPSFVPGNERSRRSSEVKSKRPTRKGMKKVKTLKNDIHENNFKVIPLMKTSTLLDDARSLSIEGIKPMFNEASIQNQTAEAKIEMTTIMNDKGITKPLNIITEGENLTEKHNNNDDHPQRIRKHSYGADNTIRLHIIEDNNKNNKSKQPLNRNVFDEDDKVWHQNAPIPDTNVYNVVPKEEQTVKETTEKGLIKVISMLTKTLKKIMKQHREVKQINEKFNILNNDFVRQVNELNGKYQDFNTKYIDITQFSKKLKAFEDKIVAEEDYLKKVHKQIEDNMIEFESQQKKFFSQQKQFYTVQKVMLAQNEKINNKQMSIAKTQSEISLKQNNFARILKKSKQMFIDNKKLTTKELTTSTERVQTTVPATESVKFNLFAISTKPKLPYNQDKDIIKEKDERTVDDLVYKYYFNNTFIDNLMKSKILKDYTIQTNSVEIARNVKNKREKNQSNQNNIATTVLLPISNNNYNIDVNNHDRVRRWISPITDVTKTLNKKDSNLIDPFTAMAKSFCTEIGQNTNEQSMKWCVEKSLRRLKNMERKLFSKDPVTVMMEKKPQALQKVTELTSNLVTTGKPLTTYPYDLSAVFMTTKVAIPVTTQLYATPQGLFFPDNEELESNLKQFDLTPDTEGNVYYDGSLHLSDLGHKGRDSDGMSDIMPGLADSNSKVEMNPMAFDIQAKRRANVNRINEGIMKKINFRKL